MQSISARGTLFFVVFPSAAKQCGQITLKRSPEIFRDIAFSINGKKNKRDNKGAVKPLCYPVCYTASTS